jgi:WD40 repeat protein
MIWDLEKAKALKILQPLQESARLVRSIEISGDGQYFFSGSQDGVVRVWDILETSIMAVKDQFEGHRNFVSSLALSPNGKNIFFGFRRCKWSLEGRQP